MKQLQLRPITLRAANAYVEQHHRHHGPKQGHKFSIAAFEGAELVGVVIVGRPDARMLNHSAIAEVTRLCTNGTKNACTKLYSAAARACAAMGYERVKTAILETESGHSLLAAGWKYSHTTEAQEWNRPSRSRKPTAQASLRKKIYYKELS